VNTSRPSRVDRARLGVCRSADAVGPSWRGGVVSIGNFDGVHRGHRAILDRCRELAAADGAAVLAITFDAHPATLLAPERVPPQLATLDERLELLAEGGADGVVVLPLDRHLLATPAEEFVRRLLVERLAIRAIVEGPDFGFGRGRGGNLSTLRTMAAEGGFRVETVEPIRVGLPDTDESVVVSSSGIRGLLSTGRIEAAAACLGRNYILGGRVVSGAGVGRTLGFPTLNLEPAGQLVPGDGVYAGRARFASADRWVAAAISIGCRPTFGGETRVVEAFLLNGESTASARLITRDQVDGTVSSSGAEKKITSSIRGDTSEFSGGSRSPEVAALNSGVRLEFVARLRDQQRFDSADALASQIARDVKRVRELVDQEREGS